MFGQEPRLPVDFFLGCVQDPVPGQVQDWVAEHQARLQVAFEGARERMLAAAGRRKEWHDQQVRESPLPVGELVYLKAHSVRGRQKIQDLWPDGLSGCEGPCRRRSGLHCCSCEQPTQGPEYAGHDEGLSPA